jgi:RHH-type transcriptional regulator, rel operon repressor / antitoxin RelB
MARVLGKSVRSTTFTVRVEAGVKKRLERLAKSTGRSRSFLAAEAINEYLEVNEWQVTGIRRAIVSLDRGEGVPQHLVKDWSPPGAALTRQHAPDPAHLPCRPPMAREPLRAHGE